MATAEQTKPTSPPVQEDHPEADQELDYISEDDQAQPQPQPQQQNAQQQRRRRVRNNPQDPNPQDDNEAIYSDEYSDDGYDYDDDYYDDDEEEEDYSDDDDQGKALQAYQAPPRTISSKDNRAITNGAINTAAKSAVGEEEGLKLKVDVNLDIEVELKARIHGDLTLSLLA